MAAHAVSAGNPNGEAGAYEFLEQLCWGTGGPTTCPHCGSDRGAWFLKPKDPAGRKSKGGSTARSQRRVWKCRESSCRRQFSVLTNTVMQGTKLPIQLWIEVVEALCTEPEGLSAVEVAERWGIAEKSALMVLDRIKHALERPEAAGASLASNAPLWLPMAAIEATEQSQARRKHHPAPTQVVPAAVVDLDPGDAVDAVTTAGAAPAETDTGYNPRIDQKQVETDVQRVLAELVETEGLFTDGWLDADSASDTTASLGPSWIDPDDNSRDEGGGSSDGEPANASQQLDLFAGEDE